MTTSPTCTTNPACGASPAFKVFAAYPSEHDTDPHPGLKRYPGAMAQPCAEHLAEFIIDDSENPGATPGYYVTRIST